MNNEGREMEEGEFIRVIFNYSFSNIFFFYKCILCKVEVHM
jgi:hypothetical protein